ncbi:MAG: YdcF family protein [Bacteroidia bacterium]
MRIFLGVCLGMVILLGLLHRPILRAMGHYLIVQDKLSQVEAMFVLSGNSFDRGREAAWLYRAGWSPKVVCLGGETNPALELYGICDLTYETTMRVLIDRRVPRSAIDSLPEGTSTFEEFEAITRYCKARNLKKIMVVSSLFHTRRIHEFFRMRLAFEGIEMVLRGADEEAFDEDAWWKAEPGLLFVNSEYIKLFYYWAKY